MQKRERVRRGGGEEEEREKVSLIGKSHFEHRPVGRGGEGSSGD